jgi:hypothetical protein
MYYDIALNRSKNDYMVGRIGLYQVLAERIWMWMARGGEALLELK